MKIYLYFYLIFYFNTTATANIIRAVKKTGKNIKIYLSFTISYLGIHVICLFYPTFFILYLPKVTLFPIILCVIPGRHHFRLLSSSVYQLNHYPFEAPIFLRIYRNIFTYLLPLKQRTKNEMKKK